MSRRLSASIGRFCNNALTDFRHIQFVLEVEDDPDFLDTLGTFFFRCMLKRNRYLIDHAACLLGICNGEWRGRTAMTVRHARKLEREVIILDPLRSDCPLPQNMV